jgi:hypothetical protein
MRRILMYRKLISFRVKFWEWQPTSKALCSWAMLFRRPRLLRANRITKVEVKYIDAASRAGYADEVNKTFE